MTTYRQTSIYRLVWRWHFYAGLMCLPIVALLSLTGAIYLFKPQLDTWRDKPYSNLEITGASLSPNILISAALSASPNGARFLSWELQKTPDSAQTITVMSGEEKLRVYLNPYNANVLTIKNADDDIASFAKILHGELLIGDRGSLIVELSACWTIVLIISGLFLWWPRRPGWAGVLYPRINHKRSLFWKDLHSVIGFWFCLLILFLLITGLPWTTVWGGAFKEIRLWSQQRVEQDWTTNRIDQVRTWGAQASDTANLSQEVLTTALSLDIALPAELSVASPTNLEHSSHSIDHPSMTQQATGGEWKLSSLSQNRSVRDDYWIDQRTGGINRHLSFSDKPIADRIIGLGIAAHEGHLFGVTNQILGLITAAGTILLCISGGMMWWQRRPSGRRFKAPYTRPETPLIMPATVIALLALLLPMLGLSLIVLLSTELCRKMISTMLGPVFR